MDKNLIVVALIAISGPLLLAWLTGRQRKAEKLQDWERQDAVAEQAAEAARLLLEQNQRVAETAAITNGKLDVIHTLVNSQLTAAMQGEFDSTVRELAMMREVIRLNEIAGQEPSDESLATVAATEKKIDELSTQMSQRLAQNDVAEKQIGAGGA